MRCCVLCVCSLAVLVVCCGVRLLPLSKICVSHTHTRRTGTLQGATSACRVTAFPHEFTSVHIGQCQPHKHVTKSRAQDDALSVLDLPSWRPWTVCMAPFPEPALPPPPEICDIEQLLLSLPDETLLSILQRLDPNGLGRLAATSTSLRSWLQSGLAQDTLWRMHCERAGLEVAGDAKLAYGRYAATLCADCARSTKYTFVLMANRRLCEECERGDPRRYALATELQLVHERSCLASLSNSHRQKVLRSLPSLELGGATWFLRSAAIEAATQLVASCSGGGGGSGGATSPDASGTCSEPSADSSIESRGEVLASALASASVREGASGNTSGGEGDGGNTSGGEGGGGNTSGGEGDGGKVAPSGDVEDDAGQADDADEAIDVAGAWDAAAAEHTARRDAASARKAAQREAQKEAQKAHKRAVKAATRAKRDGALAGQQMPRSLASASSPRAAPGSSHKPRRASAREHRTASHPDAWEREFAALEDVFGADLGGLSGLVLAVDE